MRHQVEYLLLASASFFVIRLAFSSFVQTSFVPDEYYQHVEPAYQLVFGELKNHKSPPLTWEWQAQYRIRSYVLLFPYTALFKLLKTFPALTTPFLATHGCRAIQACITAIGDTCLFLYIDEISPSRLSKFYVLFVHIFSWSVLYCGSRTLSNSTEMAAICVIMLFSSQMGRKKKKKSKNKSRIVSPEWAAAIVSILSTLMSMARPTALLFLLPYFAISRISLSLSSLPPLLQPSKPISISSSSSFLTNSRINISRLALTLQSLVPQKQDIEPIIKTIIASSRTAMACFLYDSHCYRQWTFSPYNFFIVNVVAGYSAHFGCQPWHWNFSHGLPTVLGMYTPIVMYGCFLMYRSASRSDGHGKPCLLNSIQYSRYSSGVYIAATCSLLYAVVLHVASAHQEIRFLLPCLPGLHMLCGMVIEDAAGTATICTAAACDGHERDIPYDEEDEQIQKERRKALSMRCSLVAGFMFIIAMTHFAAALYLSTVHQSGGEAAFRYLADLRVKGFQGEEFEHLDQRRKSGLPINIHLLAPCYSFPSAAFLGPDCAGTRCGFGASLNYSIHSLSCSPPHKSNDTMLFDKSPAEFFNHLSTSDRWGIPDILLTFDGYYTTDLKHALEERGLDLHRHWSHAEFKYDYDDPLPKLSVLLFVRGANRHAAKHDEGVVVALWSFFSSLTGK